MKYVFILLASLFIKTGNAQCNAAFAESPNDLFTVLQPVSPQDTAFNYLWYIHDPIIGSYLNYGYTLDFQYAENFSVNICLVVSSGTCTDSSCSQIEINGGQINPGDQRCRQYLRYTYEDGHTVAISDNNPTFPSTRYEVYIGDSLIANQIPLEITFPDTGIYTLYIARMDSETGCRTMYSVTFPIGDEIPQGCNTNFTAFETPGGDSLTIIPESTVEIMDNFYFSFSGFESQGPEPSNLFFLRDTTQFPIDDGTYEVCVVTSNMEYRCYSKTCDTITVGNPAPDANWLKVTVQPDFFNTYGGYRIELFKEDTAFGIVERIEELSTGVFDSFVKFNNLSNAYYFVRASRVQALPCFYPTYYGDQYSWQGSSIELPFSKHITIEMQSCSGIDTTGFGLLNGTFTLNDHRVSADTSQMDGRVTLLLQNNEDGSIRFRQPANHGEFSFSGLHAGSYTLYALYPGWECEPYNFSISAGNPATNVKISVISGITGMRDELSVIPELQIFPNPASDILTIKMEKPGSVRIFNSLGSLVGDHVIPASGSLNLTVAEFAQGVYFIQFTSSNDELEFIRWVKK